MRKILLITLTAAALSFKASGTTAFYQPCTPVSYEVEGRATLLTLDQLSPQYAKTIRSWKSYSNTQKMNIIENDQSGNYYGYFLKQMGMMYYYSENTAAKDVLLDAIDLLDNNFSFTPGARIVETRKMQKIGHWYRENFGRNGRLTYQAWNYTREPKVLAFLEEQVTQWMEKVPRKMHNGFNVYPYDFKTLLYEINPNQNIQLALMFSYLYFDKDSKFYQNATVKDIVFNEVNAALSLQLPSGALALSEKHLKVYDSNYGGYASGMLYELVQMWSIPAWNTKLGKIGNWLYSAFPTSSPWNVKGHAQGYHFSRDEVFNLYGRIPAFYAAGIPSSGARNWMEFTRKKFPSFSILGGVIPRWTELQSIPHSYFTSANPKVKNIKQQVPGIYAYESDNKLIISIVGRNINSISTQVGNVSKNYVVRDQTLVLNTSQGVTIKASDRSGETGSLTYKPARAVREVSLNVYDYTHPLSEKNK